MRGANNRNDRGTEREATYLSQDRSWDSGALLVEQVEVEEGFHRQFLEMEGTLWTDRGALFSSARLVLLDVEASGKKFGAFSEPQGNPEVFIRKNIILV